MDLRMLFLLFIIYSFLGWLMEVVIVSVQARKFTDRGFLIGPICPIYGFGGLLITIFLSDYLHDPLVLFVMTSFFGAVLEYFTSYIMEKIFKTRWWDYSHHKLNINGRISLPVSLSFGILGLIMLYLLNPFFINLLHRIPEIALTISSIIILIILIVDFIVSFNVISSIKRIDLSGARDTTDEITQRVKEALKSKSVLNKRLVIAFPNLKVTFKNNLEKLKNVSKTKK